ncbi:amine sulfotransferase-like [Panthera uncia]|uniref:amine sulfotransferase-like n=1 Tax=Panthera uncia TaxID=29064 RepID=UPI0020FFAA91|nr:amine sulfotransferase-like [Panthera uncia]
MEDADSFLFKFKGYHFGREELDIGFIENLDDFVIRESDVFIITYPKSGEFCILIDNQIFSTGSAYLPNYVSVLPTVLGSLWFDHIKGWYEHKSLFNIQFLMYEEMKKDLKGSLSKVCKFLGKELSEEEMDAIVRQATFQNMKYDPRANYKNIIKTRYGLEAKGHFLRKGTIGDWKNHMTVEQNERFDKIFQRKMKDFPLKFIWDMNEE